MAKTFEEAELEVNDTSKNLTHLADKILREHSVTLDKLINSLSNVEALSDEDIRNSMLKISLETYSFSELKEHSALKQACATAIMKEAQATLFNEAIGTAEVRRNQATVDSSSHATVNILYSTVADLMKTKLDEAHRVVNTLNSILISRAAAAKLNQNTNVFEE